MSSNLVKVPFHGDEIDAIERDGKVWVSLRRCCENLGLAMEGQLAKLKGKAWACMKEIFMQVPGDAQSRAYAMMDLDTLPGWLFSIEARKVKAALRDKLVRYQREAAKVLADHFLRKQSAEAAVSAAQFGQLAEAVARLTEVVFALGRQVNALAEARPAAQPGTGPRLSGPFWTVAAWLEENMPQWEPSAAQRHQIGQDAKRRVARACPTEQVGYFNRDLAFQAHQAFYLAQAAQRAHAKAIREGNARAAARLPGMGADAVDTIPFPRAA